jgi:hypothetical protein
MFAAERNPWVAHSLIPEDNGPVAEDRLAAQAAGKERAGRVAAREIQEGPLREGQFGGVKDKGWFEPANYSATGTNARDLVATIREARSHDMEVIVLLLPEPSLFRARVPREATLCLQEALRDGFGGKAPLVIDFRDLLPDRMFHDHVHLLSEGRSATTVRLIEALRTRSADSSVAK